MNAAAAHHLLADLNGSPVSASTAMGGGIGMGAATARAGGRLVPVAVKLLKKSAGPVPALPHTRNPGPDVRQFFGPPRPGGGTP